jgi:hypothetical protein
VLTVPNSFPGSVRREYLDIITNLLSQQKNLAEKVDLKNPQDEALAVINYALEKKDIIFDKNTVIGVLDLGGGTTDITFIYVNKNEIIIISTGGSAHFGGSTIDRWLLARLLRDPNPTVDEEVNGWTLSNLDHTLKETKVNHLSQEIQVNLSKLKWYFDDEVKLQNKIDTLIESLDLHQFSVNPDWKDGSKIKSHLKEPFFAKLKDTISTLLEDTLGRALEKDEIKNAAGNPNVLLFLAGNGSKIAGFTDIVQEAIADKFDDQIANRDVFLLSRPKEAVALGARGFLNIGFEINRKKYGPPNSYYAKVPPLMNLSDQIYLPNKIKALPIIVEGEASKFESEDIIKEYSPSDLGITPDRKSLQIIEKTGIDYNELNIIISGEPPFRKIKFVLNNGILKAQGISNQ